jgi:soluble lytic murein transglycosylase-like protein
VSHASKWFRPQIEAAAKPHKIDPDLVEAIVRTESSGLTHAFRNEPGFWRRYLLDDPYYNTQDPLRVSSSYGLMQIMYPTARENGYKGEPEGLFVPSVNLDVGCCFLASLLRWSNGIVPQALAAYNGGKGGNGAPPYRNQSYVSKVLATWTHIKEER